MPSLNPSEVLQPGKQALDLPTPSIAPLTLERFKRGAAWFRSGMQTSML